MAAYVALLFMLNMFIIINSQSAFDILLNALAFEVGWTSIRLVCVCVCDQD